MAPCYTPGGMYRLMGTYGNMSPFLVVGVVNLGSWAGNGSLVIAINDLDQDVIVFYVPADGLSVDYVDHAHSLAEGYRLLAQRLTAYADGAREPAAIACRVPA